MTLAVCLVVIVAELTDWAAKNQITLHFAGADFTIFLDHKREIASFAQDALVPADGTAKPRHWKSGFRPPQPVNEAE